MKQRTPRKRRFFSEINDMLRHRRQDDTAEEKQNRIQRYRQKLMPPVYSDDINKRFFVLLFYAELNTYTLPENDFGTFPAAFAFSRTANKCRISRVFCRPKENSSFDEELSLI